MNRFNKEKVDWILEIRGGTRNTLVRRESTQLEFKKNFNFGSLHEYGKILSAMANNKGGYIIFGITDKRPHKLIGMSNNQFERIDSSKISELFDYHFSPMLIWEHHIESRGEIKIGFLHVESSREKPVMCIKSGNKGEYNECDIYYRYAGKTSRIRSSELQEIVRGRIDNENMKWQRLLGNIAKVSPSKASLLNIESGEIIGDRNTILVDENLLSKMKFIKEGEFDEVEGNPVYKIVGEIQDVKSATFIEKKINVPTLVHRTNIIDSFLNEECDDPLTYLKQFPYENTHYLPFWFFIRISDLSIDEVENIWEELQDTQNSVRTKLIERLRNENVDRLKVNKIFDLEGECRINNIDEYNNKFQECISLNRIKTTRKLAIERSFIFELMNNGCLKHFTNEFIKSKDRLIIEAITNLEKNKIVDNKEQIFIIIKWINEISTPPVYSLSLRKCMCYVDCMLNKADVSEYDYQSDHDASQTPPPLYETPPPQNPPRSPKCPENP